jgi:hypothetical protein
MPLSRKYSPIVQPVNGARYCIGSRVGSGRGDDDRVFQSAAFFEHLDELGNGRTLLADCDVDAVELLALVIACVHWLLVEERVENDRGLAGLTVTNDELALAAANRDQRIDCLQASRHRLVHRLARQNARCLDVDAHHRGAFDRALAIDRVAERVDNAAKQALADRNFHDGAGPLDGVAFLDRAVIAEKHDTDVVGFEVQRHPTDAAVELDHLAGLDVVEAVDAGDAVTDGQNLTDFRNLGFLAEVLICSFRIEEISAARMSIF